MITLLIIIIVASIVFGLAISPIIAVIVVASQKVCTGCKKRIPRNASICSYCQSEQISNK